ncbi:hypothetical protein DACRYDRAFT_106149 [Dacryopinax primogenitus]|uniref:Uncharacterized protein n=1 Tax=Dacryopinax primogenitus (strain DJM 731) TaxID=1858805 RepID=M5GAJ1_DACPD|nr:uncharacterized protein DACRYDRAFT_106149 [Dacryopinax primogenitus]EJU02972.1 hypothetical protein DACRYDRAFT_106149 [Dacryopinax primogenitus]
MPAAKPYKLSTSGLLSPSYPSSYNGMHRPTPVQSSSWLPTPPLLDLDALDRELETISQKSTTTSLRASLHAELDAEIDEILRSPAARAAWEDVQDDMDSIVPSSPWSSLSSRRSSRSSRSSVGDRPAVYPDPIGTPPRKPASTSSEASSSEPVTPSSSHACSPVKAPERRKVEKREEDHPCVPFWRHCTPSHLLTLEHFTALMLSNGLSLVSQDWRKMDVSEMEKERTRRVWEGLLEQYAALKAYRVSRGYTAEELLEELM